MDWSDAMRATLRRLWAEEGLTTPDIAERMGLNKNQVIGQAYRLRLPPRRSPIKSPIVRRVRPGPNPNEGGAEGLAQVRVATAKPPRQATQGAQARRTPPPPALAPPALAPLDAGGCRWLLWHDERPTHRYCEAQRRDVLCPYCPTHAARAFTKPPAGQGQGRVTGTHLPHPRLPRHEAIEAVRHELHLRGIPRDEAIMALGGLLIALLQAEPSPPIRASYVIALSACFADTVTPA